MARRELTRSLQVAVESLRSAPRPFCQRTATLRFQPRYFSTTLPRKLADDNKTQKLEPFNAAPPIDFEKTKENRKMKEMKETKKMKKMKEMEKMEEDEGEEEEDHFDNLRVVPASASYFSAKPTFTDDYINLSALLRKVATLPIIPKAEAPKVAWKTIEQYRIMTNEPVKTQRYHMMLHILRRLNCIHPEIMPEEVRTSLERYKKEVQPGDLLPIPGVIDEWGRAKGVGRRKTSSATAFLVEGEGEVLINGQSLTTFFGRLHHRESAVWALKASQRLDKYNVFGLVTGGGTTGQAEALTLAIAKALLVHEPALKPVLRRAGCITRDPRRVERKKTGHLKARKMPAWVKR